MLVPIGFGQTPDAQHLVPVELGGGEPGVHLPCLGGLGGGAHPLNPPLDVHRPAVGLVHPLKGPQPELLRRLLQVGNLGLRLLILAHPLQIAALLLNGVKAVVPGVKLCLAV